MDEARRREIARKLLALYATTGARWVTRSACHISAAPSRPRCLCCASSDCSLDLGETARALGFDDGFALGEWQDKQSWDDVVALLTRVAEGGESDG